MGAVLWWRLAAARIPCCVGACSAVGVVFRAVQWSSSYVPGKEGKLSVIWWRLLEPKVMMVDAEGVEGFTGCTGDHATTEGLELL